MFAIAGELIGAAIVLLGLYIGWSARPRGIALVRRVMFLPYIEPIFPVLLFSLIALGVGILLASMGVEIDQPFGTGVSLPD